MCTTWRVGYRKTCPLFCLPLSTLNMERLQYAPACISNRSQTVDSRVESRPLPTDWWDRERAVDQRTGALGTHVLRKIPRRRDALALCESNL